MFNLLLQTQFGQNTLNTIIRPERNSYYSLYPVEGMQRIDFILTSYFDNQLQCSLLRPDHLESDTVIVYIHGNSGNRQEGFLSAPYLLQYNFSLLVFDLSGCGQSTGDYVTLGIREQHDVVTVVNYAKQIGFQNVVLWGRSMGAVSALLAANKCEVNYIISDSAFESFAKLTEEVGSTKFNIPSFFVSLAEGSMQEKIIEKTKFDPYKINLIPQVRQLIQPILFVFSYEDTLVNCSHSINLFKNYKGYKEYYIFQGEHNSIKGPEYYEYCLNFINNQIVIDQNNPHYYDHNNHSAQNQNNKLDSHRRINNYANQQGTFQYKNN